MKNERGLTLVELLAVLAIAAIIISLIGSVLINGIKASNRTTTKQQLQQEANNITEVVRREYLEQKSGLFLIEVDNGNKTLKIENKIISEGYNYKFCDEDEEGNEEDGCNGEWKDSITVYHSGNNKFNLKVSRGELFYMTETTLSKLH